MTRYAAFLRAINVGGRYVKMDALRAILAQEPRLANLQTYIASGNLIFDAATAAPELESAIERILQAGLGYAVPAFVRTADEVRAAAEFQPFGDAVQQPGAALMVSFLRQAPSADDTAALMDAQTQTDRLHVEGREVYWLRLPSVLPELISNATFERILGPATMRNIKTVRAMAQRYF